MTPDAAHSASAPGSALGPAATPLAVPLREPPGGALWPAEILERSGLETMRGFLDGRLPAPPVSVLTGLRLSEVGLGSAAVAMPASGWWQSGAGTFLAGTIAFVADLTASAAILTSAPAGMLVTSSQLSVSYMRPATVRSAQLIGRGRLIHATRSLGLSEATIQDGRGRLLGHATSRCVLVAADRRVLPASSGTPAPRPHMRPDPWARPVEGNVLGQEFWDSLPGIDIVRQIVGGGLRPPVTLLLDLRGTDVREGEVTMTMPASPWLCNAFGTVYGGAIAMLADVATTLAVGSTVPAATAYSPLDATVHFLRPVLPDPQALLTARARVTHRGRTIAVTSCEITDSRGKLAAQASGSTLILPGRPWEKPVNVGEEMAAEG